MYRERKQLLRNLLRKIAVLITWRERKDNKYKEEHTGQRRLSVPRYNLSLLFCIPNMNLLSYTVVEISLTKNIQRKNNKQESAGSQFHDTTCRWDDIYQICKANTNFLSETVLEIPLTKKYNEIM